MKSSHAKIWKDIIEMSPICSGTLHEEYLPCGKKNCVCHHPTEPKPHGPYYSWRRRVGGRQVVRMLRPGPDVEKIQLGIQNYRRMQELLSKLLLEEENQILTAERGVSIEGKKNFRRRLTNQ